MGTSAKLIYEIITSWDITLPAFDKEVWLRSERSVSTFDRFRYSQQVLLIA